MLVRGHILLSVHFFTQMGQRTLAASWRAGDADFPPKENDPVTEVTAFLRGQNGSELAFHLFRLLTLGKTQTAADADTVGITDNAAGLTVKVTQ